VLDNVKIKVAKVAAEKAPYKIPKSEEIKGEIQLLISLEFTLPYRQN
jgi:hypothetical protein